MAKASSKPKAMYARILGGGWGTGRDLLQVPFDIPFFYSINDNGFRSFRTGAQRVKPREKFL
jgi:hypothetical protein